MTLGCLSVTTAGSLYLRTHTVRRSITNPGLQPVPEPFASTVVPCLVVDEWLYERGPGSLAATVRFRAGVVLSITYGARATR